MSSISRDSRQTTTQRPDRHAQNPAGEQDEQQPPSHHDPSLVDEIREEITELPHELAGAAEHVIEEVEDVAEHVVEEVEEAAEFVLEEIEESAVGRWAIRTYLWLMDKAPTSTRGRLILAALIFVIVLIPSGALLYFTWGKQDSTESWFGDLGYAGVFLANLASTATLFIPVPGLTAAAQALIVSSAASLSAFWVGVLGGLGMALGEVTAYVAGMAAAVIAREEEIKAPSRLEPIIQRITGWVNKLMARFGMPTLFLLSVFPNPLFEVAGWTAGATRYSFWKFMGSVTPGKIVRGLLLAYIGEKLIFG
jgi:membrane protein YqaA with SNARE-associated domain